MSKRFFGLILLLQICTICNTQISMASTGVIITEEITNKIAYPYNRALENGTWKLIEYTENEDESIEYVMQLNDETISNVKQKKVGDRYILEIYENGLHNAITVDVNAENNQKEFEQQMIYELQEKDKTTEKNTINEKIIFVSGIVVFLLIKLFVRFNK